MLQVTQETLADLSGVGLRTLKQFESGKGNPTAETLNKLGSALGMELTFKIIKTETSEWDRPKFSTKKQLQVCWRN